MTKKIIPGDIVKINMSFKGKYVYITKVKRYLWENLNAGGRLGTTKTKWVKNMCMHDFGIELNSTENLMKIEEAIAASNYYMNLTDWLGDKIRHCISEMDS